MESYRDRGKVMALVDEKALRALHQLVPANEKWYVIQPRGEPAQECYCG